MLVIIALVSATASAQWPRRQKPDLPRTADGQVDLNAPTPRTPEGHPDLSGVWLAGLGRGAGGGGRAGGQAGAAQGGAARQGGPPQAPAAPALPDGIVASNFAEVAGRGGAPMTAWAAELKKTRMAVKSKDNPDALCLPMGLMQFHNHPQPRRFVQTKDLIVIIYEANYGLRQIHMDGRAAPPADAQPYWYGYSRGRWEGDTLVVETTNYYGDERAGWLDVNGTPYTDALETTERFRRTSLGRMEIDITFEDPKAFTKPFTVRVNHRLSVDDDLIEFICHENQQFGTIIKLN